MLIFTSVTSVLKLNDKTDGDLYQNKFELKK